MNLFKKLFKGKNNAEPISAHQHELDTLIIKMSEDIKAYTQYNLEQDYDSADSMDYKMAMDMCRLEYLTETVNYREYLDRCDLVERRYGDRSKEDV